MKRIIFLLEEYSMSVFLEEFIPRAFPGLKYLCVHHDGKNDLERSIPRKLRAWREPGVTFVIVRDNDGDDCIGLKTRLAQLCADSGRPESMIRIACQELEAWYLGDPEAMAVAFADDRLKEIGRKARYRDPDAILRPAEQLSVLIPSFQKTRAARAMGKQIDPVARVSRSYSVFVDGLKTLWNRMEAAEEV